MSRCSAMQLQAVIEEAVSETIKLISTVLRKLITKVLRIEA